MALTKEQRDIQKNKRLGEERVMNCGLKCKIIEYINSKNITVEFETGEIVKNRWYSNFVRQTIGLDIVNRDLLVGKKFDKISVISIKERKLRKDGYYDYYYNCKCDCGRDIIKSSRSILSNKYKNSCGICPNTIEETINYKYPEMIKYFKDINDTFRYKCGSKSKVTFVCDICGNEKEASIGSVLTRGFSCPICSDNISYPEKFIMEFLRQCNLKFQHDVSFDWSQNKRYDFYISSLNCIIETHGLQHYEDSFSRIGGRSSKEEKENDIIKEGLASKNNIDNYIVLDCRQSNKEQIKKSIINSKICQMININYIDFEKCSEFATSNIVKEICDIWNNMIDKRTKQIAEFFNISIATVSSYLKIGNELGWCEYDSKKSASLYRDNQKIAESKEKRVKCIEIDKEFKSINNCCEYMNNNTNKRFVRQGISANCRNKIKHYRKYHFKYID